MREPKRASIPASILAVVALAAGALALTIGMIQGRRAGSETMMIYASPAIVAAIIAIALRRNVLTYLGVLGGILAIVGLVLGQ